MTINPRSKYNVPQDLINDKHLSQEEKVRLLKDWADDELQYAIAEEENMLRTATSGPNLLSEVLKCLLSVGVEYDPHT